MRRMLDINIMSLVLLTMRLWSCVTCMGGSYQRWEAVGAMKGRFLERIAP